MNLQEALNSIKPLDKKAMQECSDRWDSICKPLYAFGKFETETQRMAGIFGTNKVNLDKKAVVIMCADHGVLEEGVSQSTQDITVSMTEGFSQMKCSVSVMADYAGVDVFPVDIGVATDVNAICHKIAYGTKNMAKEPAMTREQAIASIEVGIHMAEELKEKGYKVICVGEMGVGNTTAASAMASVMLDLPVRKVTGRGSGLTKEGLEKKIQVLERIMKVHTFDKTDPIDILTKVGGFEIGGMAGLYIGGAAVGLPVVVDGMITCVAALLAARLDERVKDYMFPSHVSKEPAGQLLLDALGFEPLLTCGMHLGEGTGAVALMPLFDMVLDVYNRMSTFEDHQMMVYEPYLEDDEQ
jgi:nicotinate-nucleotide--dimethylbenzimidazole phosphoribosyltransferase